MVQFKVYYGPALVNASGSQLKSQKGHRNRPALTNLQLGSLLALYLPSRTELNHFRRNKTLFRAFTKFNTRLAPNQKLQSMLPSRNEEANNSIYTA